MSDLDKDLARLLREADAAGVPRPDAPAPPAADAAPATPPPPPVKPLTPADPAVQIVESAHQVLTMIGANPRAIRPILAQRRLSKDAILESAASVAERAAQVLAALDATEGARRAAAEESLAQIRAQMSAEDADAAKVAAAEDAIIAECDAVRARIGRVQARFGISELPAVAAPAEPEEEERHGLFARLVEELTDNRIVGAFVRVNRPDPEDATAAGDGRILRADHPAVVTLVNMDEFVQATDPATPQADLLKTWCELSGVTDADVRQALAGAQDLAARQTAQSTEVKRQSDEAHRAETARLQGGLDAAAAQLARAEAEIRTQRTFTSGLRDRAARVSEAYQNV